MGPPSFQRSQNVGGPWYVISIPFREWGPEDSSHDGRKFQGYQSRTLGGSPSSQARCNHPARSPHPAAKPLRPMGDRGLEPLTSCVSSRYELLT